VVTSLRILREALSKLPRRNSAPPKTATSIRTLQIQPLGYPSMVRYTVLKLGTQLVGRTRNICRWWKKTARFFDTLPVRFKGVLWGANLFWNPMYKCPEIRPKIPEIQPKMPEISVICEIRPKIFEIRLGNLEIWPKILKSLKSDVKFLEYGLKTFKVDLKSLKFDPKSMKPD